MKYETLKKDPLGGFKEIFNFLNIRTEVKKEIIDKKVFLSEHSDRPRATASGWKIKDNYEKYELIIIEVRRRLKNEIKMLGYEK